MSDVVAPSKGAMKAALEIGQRFESGPIWAEDVAEVIDRETKSPQMYAELFRALAVIRNPQAFDTASVADDIERLLSELEVKP